MRRIVLALALALAGSTLGTCRTAPATIAPPMIEWAGDSLTAGWYADTAGSSFRNLVDRDERAIGVTLPASGPGVTAGEVAAAFDSGQTAISPDLPADGLVVVELGINDFSQDHTLPRFTADYADVIHHIVDEDHGARLRCLGIWNAEATVNAAGVSGAQVDAQIAAQCHEAGGVYLSLQAINGPANVGPVGSPSYLGPRDNFHPNQSGHDAIAAAILASL